MAEMKEAQIYAVPTFAILEYFGAHSPNGDGITVCWRSMRHSSNGNWRQECRLRWVATGRFRTGRKRGSLS